VDISRSNSTQKKERNHEHDPGAEQVLREDRHVGVEGAVAGRSQGAGDAGEGGADQVGRLQAHRFRVLVPTILRYPLRDYQ
jgi:hypothetical protein